MKHVYRLICCALFIEAIFSTSQDGIYSTETWTVGQTVSVTCQVTIANLNTSCPKPANRTSIYNDRYSQAELWGRDYNACDGSTIGGNKWCEENGITKTFGYNFTVGSWSAGTWTCKVICLDQYDNLYGYICPKSLTPTIIGMSQEGIYSTNDTWTIGQTASVTCQVNIANLKTSCPGPNSFAIIQGTFYRNELKSYYTACDESIISRNKWCEDNGITRSFGYNFTVTSLSGGPWTCSIGCVDQFGNGNGYIYPKSLTPTIIDISKDGIYSTETWTIGQIVSVTCQVNTTNLVNNCPKPRNVLYIRKDSIRQAYFDGRYYTACDRPRFRIGNDWCNKNGAIRSYGFNFTVTPYSAGTWTCTILCEDNKRYRYNYVYPKSLTPTIIVGEATNQYTNVRESNGASRSIHENQMKFYYRMANNLG